MRRTLLLVFVLGFIGLGVILYTNVRESHLFQLSAPVTRSTPSQSLVSGTTANLSGVSATTLLENPRYTGQDAQNRSWEVTALNAAQQGTAASTTLILQQVDANLEVPDKNTPERKHINLKSEEGTYQQSTDLLHLNGNVQVAGQGITLTAPAITTNLKTRHMVATGGVHATLTMPAKSKK